MKSFIISRALGFNYDNNIYNLYSRSIYPRMKLIRSWFYLLTALIKRDLPFSPRSALRVASSWAIWTLRAFSLCLHSLSRSMSNALQSHKNFSYEEPQQAINPLLYYFIDNQSTKIAFLMNRSGVSWVDDCIKQLLYPHTHAHATTMLAFLVFYSEQHLITWTDSKYL